MTVSSKKPTLGVLLGDSSGIGPEIVAKLISRAEIYETANVVIVGDYRVFSDGAEGCRALPARRGNG